MCGDEKIKICENCKDNFKTISEQIDEICRLNNSKISLEKANEQQYVKINAQEITIKELNKTVVKLKKKLSISRKTLDQIKGSIDICKGFMEE